MQFQYKGAMVTLHGEQCTDYAYTCVEIALIRECPSKQPVLAPEIQDLRQPFEAVFATPTELPPRRHYDHIIPLVPGARPFSIRPYRLAPELKTEVERQIAEMLESGVI